MVEFVLKLITSRNLNYTILKSQKLKFFNLKYFRTENLKVSGGDMGVIFVVGWENIFKHISSNMFVIWQLI